MPDYYPGLIIEQHEDDVLDYTFDFSEFLTGSEVIASHTVTIDTGLTKSNDSHNDTSVVFWISGGTAGEKYACEVQITTDSSPARVYNLTLAFDVVDVRTAQ